MGIKVNVKRKRPSLVTFPSENTFMSWKEDPKGTSTLVILLLTLCFGVLHVKILGVSC